MNIGIANSLGETLLKLDTMKKEAKREEKERIIKLLDSYGCSQASQILKELDN